MKNIILLLIFCSLTACSFAPLSSNKTAKSLEPGTWQIEGGASPAPNLNISRGISDNFDLGVILERQMFPQLAIWGKYSFLNNKQNGTSFAFVLGGSRALDITDTSSFYGGPIISYKSHWFECYFLARYNWVKWRANDLSDEDQSDFFVDLLSWEDDDFDYMQYVFGMNFWFSAGFALNINGKILDMLGGEVTNDSSTVVPSLNLIWNY